MPNLAERFFFAFITITKFASLQFLGLFGVLFISGLALTFISKWTSNSFRQFRFPKFGLYLFGIIGIPLHELCHAIFAKVFFHDIDSIKWFDPSAKGGSYGTVVHYYNERNLFHRIGLFFIGLGPVLLAPLFLFLGYKFLVPQAASMASLGAPHALETALDFMKTLTATANWNSLRFYVFLYLAACLTSQMELSPDDFKVARGGILPIFLLVFVFNVAAYIFQWNLHRHWLNGFNTIVALWSVCFVTALVISVLNLLACFILLSLLNRLMGRPGINPFDSEC